MNKKWTKDMRIEIFSLFFYILIKNKELNWIYTNNVPILGIAKEK